MIKIMLFAFIAGLLIGLVIPNPINSTGRVVEETSYSYTTASCNEYNECIDIIVGCKNGRVTSLNPILTVARHPENWTDPRGNISSFCE